MKCEYTQYLTPLQSLSIIYLFYRSRQLASLAFQFLIDELEQAPLNLVKWCWRMIFVFQIRTFK